MKPSPFRQQPTARELYTPLAFADQAQQMLARAQSRFGADRFRMEEPDDDADAKAAADKAAADKAAADAAAAADADKNEKLELDKLPKEVQDLVKKYRKEAAEASGKARDEAKTKAAEDARAALIKEVGKTLGLVKDDEKLTPEEFEKKLAEAGSETASAKAAAREKDIELAVYRGASKAGGDPDALLDSRGFLAKLKDLDPSAKDFNEKVSAAIKDAVKENSKLKLQAGAGSSSADHGGAGGDTGTKTAKSLADAVGGHYGV